MAAYRTRHWLDEEFKRAGQLQGLLAESCALAPTETTEYAVQRFVPEFAERLSELQAEFVADQQALLMEKVPCTCFFSNHYIT